jgi:protein-S-isoprenylcysteine O-methyltransferase Ste14
MQRKIRNEEIPGAGATATVRAAAVVCVALGVGGQAVFTLFVLLLGLDALPRPSALPSAWPWAVDVAWLVVFAAQHSGMARPGFKRRWTRVVPPALERAVYVALSGLLLLGMSLTWQPLPGEPLWRLPAWFVGVSLAGAVGTMAVCGQVDQLRFFGLRQAWRPDAANEPLRVTGPYRFVRHPLMTCTLLFLWGQPVMPPELALLNGGLTAYILLALPLEERDLRRQFGAAYDDYRRRVPALIPWRKPAPRAVHDLQSQVGP